MANIEKSTDRAADKPDKVAKKTKSIVKDHDRDDDDTCDDLDDGDIEDIVERASMESFPASDPPAFIQMIGVPSEPFNGKRQQCKKAKEWPPKSKKGLGQRNTTPHL